MARGSAETSCHFIGVQVAEAAAFAMLPDSLPFESVRQLYPNLVATRPGSVRTFLTEAEFFDIGTPADYLDTSLLISAREASGSALWASGLEDCVLWDDVSVGLNVHLRRCIVADGVRIPDGAQFEQSTIRLARGELMPAERRAGDLAIGPIDTGNRRHR